MIKVSSFLKHSRVAFSMFDVHNYSLETFDKFLVIHFSLINVSRNILIRLRIRNKTDTVRERL